MMASGLMINSTVLDWKSGLMEPVIKDITEMDRNMEKVILSGLMDLLIVEISI